VSDTDTLGAKSHVSDTSYIIINVPGKQLCVWLHITATCLVRSYVSGCQTYARYIIYHRKSHDLQKWSFSNLSSHKQSYAQPIITQTVILSNAFHTQTILQLKCRSANRQTGRHRQTDRDSFTDTKTDRIWYRQLNCSNKLKIFLLTFQATGPTNNTCDSQDYQDYIVLVQIF